MSETDSDHKIGEILTEPLRRAIGDRYLTYALSTIMHRALPDARDGLKPVHRRILYAMRELRLVSTGGFRKSAKISGDVMGNYHPHGDAAIYDAMARLAQDFNVRYPLVDGQGNFGNIDGDNPAASRYTEARMTMVAEALLEGLDENAVDFRENYDGTLSEPIVLPASFPNLLANGSSGIAVGMATNIPPHNIAELCDACLHLIKKPDARNETLLNFVPGPDFPTGGVIVESPESITEAYRTGRGSFRLRANWEVEHLDRGQWQIIVKEIPYQVQKSKLIEKLAELIQTKIDQYEPNDEKDKKKFSQVIDQDVYFGNMPYMTDKGTFIINGAERTVVTQLQRSPGAFFDQKFHPNGAKLYNARIIPIRGSWIDFTTDINDVLFTIIARKRKFPATLLLRSLGFSSDEDIYNAFGLIQDLNPSKIDEDKLSHYVVIEDIIDHETGELFVESGKELNESIVKTLKKNKAKSIKVVDVRNNIDSMMLHNTIQKDPTKSTEEALVRVYYLLRGSEAPSPESAEKFIHRMFFFPKKYDLGQVGRYRLDKQFNLDNTGKDAVLTHDDFLITLKFLIQMRKGLRAPDDIDHLGNRRVRTVGEQLKVQFNSALARMVRTVYERMNLRESETITPQDLINSRLVTTVINTFFGTSQLSQFGDQTNPLAEITHKRRISSLGPGGLSRERAGFEVRDVHYTHYGRLCPIETPEGPNIGLISSLALMAKINRHGFIEAPYRKIDDKTLTSKVQYLSADDEDRSNIAQSGLEADKKGLISESKIRVRSKFNESSFFKVNLVPFLIKTLLLLSFIPKLDLSLRRPFKSLSLDARNSLSSLRFVF